MLITFDIETIPQENLTALQEEELNKKFLNSNSPQTEDYKVLLASTNPLLGQIVCIGVVTYDPNTLKKSSYYIAGPEREILQDFWKIIEHDKGNTYISFNGVNFDAPFIIKRSMHHKIPATSKNFMDLRRYQTWPHFDVKAVFNNYDSYVSGTLATICEFLGVDSPKNGEIKGNNVYEAYKKGRIQEIGEYCIKDVIATYECYDIIKNYTK